MEHTNAIFPYLVNFFQALTGCDHSSMGVVTKLLFHNMVTDTAYTHKPIL